MTNFACRPSGASLSVRNSALTFASLTGKGEAVLDAGDTDLVDPHRRP